MAEALDFFRRGLIECPVTVVGLSELQKVSVHSGGPQEYGDECCNILSKMHCHTFDDPRLHLSPQ